MTLYVSPHHDDVVLSLALMLLRPDDEPPTVVVVFSEEDERLAAACNAIHRELNVGVECLGLMEASRRGVSVRECFRPNRNIDDLDPEDIGRAAAALSVAVTRLRATRLIAPLLPMHVDHAITRTAAEKVASSAGLPTLFYEDQPYASLFPSAVHAESRGRRIVSGASPAVRPDRIAGIFERLRPFVSGRDLARILRHLDPCGYAHAGTGM